MSRPSLSILSALALLLGGASVASAAPPDDSRLAAAPSRMDADEDGARGDRRRGPPPLHKVLERHAETLGLDAEVLAEAEAVGGEAEQRLRALHKAAKAERRSLEALVEDFDSTAEEVLAQADRLSDAESLMQRERLSILLDVRALLTAEQWAQVQELKPKQRPGGDEDRSGPPPPRRGRSGR